MYQPESYWNEVAERISEREGLNVIAGDDEPYYVYKRKRFLKLLRALPFENRRVLEVGSGPGGNLLEISSFHPSELHGADVSENMIRIASARLKNKATISKTDGRNLPYADHYFDVAFTSTVLQHNTDENMLRQLCGEIARVSGKHLFLFEKIEKKLKGTELCMGRPVAYYENIFEEHGFQLEGVKFLDIGVSYFVSGSIRKLFNRRSRKEGERESFFSRTLQQLTLPLTSVLDKIYRPQREVAMLHFMRRK